MSPAPFHRLSRLGLAAALLATAAPALAALRREGEWPKSEKAVTLDLSRTPRADALRKLAEAAGWGLLTRGVDEGLVDLHVKNQPADKVLELLLSEGDYVAQRSGTLLSIRGEGAPGPGGAPPSPPSPPDAPVPPAPPAPPVPAAPPVPPVPTVRGEDRSVRGGNVKVAADEVVHDITVYGGSVQIWGTVTGNVSVFGGSVHLHPKSHVYGSATVLGGSMRLEDESRVDGDVGVMGGNLKRSQKAIIGGKVNTAGGHDDGDDGDDGDDDDDDDKPHVRVTISGDDDGPKAESKGSKAAKAGDGRSLAARAYDQVSDAVQGATVLFLFGVVFIALAGSRFEKLQEAVAARPMKALAMGFLGVLASGVLLLALAVSVVGIPFAIVAALLAPLGGAAGVCAALSTLGRGLSGHRTTNPYVHLAVGCALLAAAVSIPFAEDVVTLALIFMGFGAFVVTRAAGFVPPSKRNGPYRTSATG
ncbi:MAG TPA: polymer-forming cytoskeletal protein [Polyangiaceae bacterium]|nr:polymer-forming cytoskeletal protein [Polyangiaceae bacterium]